MNKVICTTTINPPTEATRKFAQIAFEKRWQFVIAGDSKTPHNDYERLEAEFGDAVWYMHPDQQEKLDGELSNLIGWNCIQRRNMAFLYACKELDAEIVATVDDDNIPLPGWGDTIYIGKEVECSEYHTSGDIADPLKAAGDPVRWHRGFPLEMVRARNGMVQDGVCTPTVQADLWNGNGDVDAVCRMIHGDICVFDQSRLPLCFDKPVPFNSQNTFIHRSEMHNYFMFPSVGRHDDIVASFYAQACGARVIFGRPSVFQRRNVHDVMQDFSKEVWGYTNMSNLVRALKENPIKINDFIPGRSMAAFYKYQTNFR